MCESHYIHPGKRAEYGGVTFLNMVPVWLDMEVGTHQTTDPWIVLNPFPTPGFGREGDFKGSRLCAPATAENDRFSGSFLAEIWN